MVIVIVIVIGLVVGSFLNAVIFRLHTGKSIVSGRSECMRCHHQLAAIDLVPLFSFLFLRGRCHYCRKKISWQYPIIETATALSFVLLFRNFQFSVTGYQFFAQAIFICFLIVIGTYDLKHYLILDKVVYPAAVLAFIVSVINHSLLSGLYGVLVVSGFFALQYLLSSGRWIGFGDVKLGIFLGLLFGWELGILLLLIAYLAGAVVGIGLIASGKKNFGSKVPFGTFLAGASIIVMLYGQGMLNCYLKLIGF